MLHSLLAIIYTYTNLSTGRGGGGVILYMNGINKFNTVGIAFAFALLLIIYINWTAFGIGDDKFDSRSFELTESDGNSDFLIFI